ncbi:UDP-glucose pyrophosphorylase [Dunaliella salina]|uniref:UTP--glucose-1-phosphate uridylyltransferase n=1 Tax=Dunaliella salina TaxID=3046 RepID=A0ABQ7GZ02_DUNSA|nr:UDP-glucose pyrophosphorylase [Dunaliella salina]|eukprot:KAF5839822.1 UDP-glucose pyrophosphorylase [Dunaliella salina]
MASTWDALEQKCKQRGLSDAAIAAFKNNYTQLQQGATGLVPETDIEAVAQLPKLTDLPTPKQDEIKDLLSKTAMLKLNGGLGTSMGLEKAKSLLVVKEGKTFLDLIAEQVKHMRATYGSKVAFTLMDSFSTSADTRAFLQQKHSDLLQEPYIELMQNMSPKVDANTLGPASYPENPDNEWNPPGHGDIYPSLLGSGMLDKMLGAGIKYLFVSNSDNLGATLDLTLLSWFASSGNAFLMEVSPREHLEGCESMETFGGRHKFFNTNNLWLNLEELKGTLASTGGFLPLPLIKNKKMGSAVECFAKSGAVQVPRSRFAPVKTCNDLLVLRSDVYKIEEDATVQLVRPSSEVPLVKLDDAHFKLVDAMEKHIPPGSEPSLVGAKSLVVKGPVKFSKGVVIQGEATVEAAAQPEASLAPGTYTGPVKVEAPAAAAAK